MTDTKKPDLKELLADPSAHYDAPMDVARDTRLSDAEKRRVLEEWKLDAHELLVADEEGMEGGEPNMMARVQQALDALGARG